MSIALLVITDGRDDLLEQTLASAAIHLHGLITTRVLYDDTGDIAHARVLQAAHPDFEVLGGDHRRGFGGAIQHAWTYLANLDEKYVFHLEDDFTFNEHINLAAMAAVLDMYPHLVQLALKRQPWNDEERAAGGIIEQHPEDYEVLDILGLNSYGNAGRGIDAITEHRRFFTTNPSLYRRYLCANRWPDGADSEGMFTHRLLADPAARFGFWGRRNDPPKVHHIGHERVGVGY